MKLRELYEDGRIVKGVNTTPDVDINSISKEASKFGFKVDKDGRPPVLKKSERGQSTNVMFNLGMTESRFTPMEMAIMEGGHSIEDLHVTESDLLVQQYSTPSLLKFLKKLSDLPVDVLLKKAIQKELKKRGIKTESLQEIKAVTNIDKGEEIYIPASDHKKAAYETKIKGYEIYRAKSKLGPMPLEHFLIKDPDSDGYLGELKLTGFYKYYTSDVFFDPRIQGKGLALPLYAYVVKKGYTLVSDREQSKGSQAIWKNLTKVPGIFVYAWDRKYDEFFQWNPEEDLDSEIYHDQDKLDQLEKDYKDGKVSDEDYKKAKDELEQVQRLSDVRLVAIADKKSKVKEDKMGAINIDSALKNTPEEWRIWIKTLPPQLAQEFIDERPTPDEEDINVFTKLRLTSDKPVKVSTKALLKEPWMKGSISRTPQPVVDAINKRYGTNFKGGTVYDRNPDRFFKYAKMSAATAKPSVMVNGDVIFGVGRMIAALLRGDESVLVWDLKG